MPKSDRVTGKHIVRNSVFIDTSAWIALFSRRDQNHQEADRLFRGIVTAKRQLITTNLVLAEIHRLLLYRAGIQAAATALAKIEASPLVRIEFAREAHHQSAKRWIDRLNAYPISYTDAISFAVMEASGCIEALSYDRHFRIAGFTIAKTLS